MEERKNRLKNARLGPKTGENRPESPDSGPILDPGQASDLFGEESAAFVRDLCGLVRRHGVEGVVVVVLHQGVIRTASTGVHPVARDHAKAIAVRLAEVMSTPSREGRPCP